jgi:DNA modification methylase
MIAESLQELAVPLDDLDALEGNPRRGDVDAVMRSYAAFGQRKPIVARRKPDGRGEVTAGNTQLAAARALGWPALAVVWVDDDDATSKAWALADNRTSDLGLYDEAALTAYLQSVRLDGDDDLFAATGYDAADLARLAQRWDTKGDPEDVPEAPQTPRTQSGDLWRLGPHRLLCGDSTAPDDLARLMDGETAALLATDPPYLVDYDASNHPQSYSNTRNGKTANKAHPDYHEGAADLYERFLAACLPHCAADVVVYQWHAHARTNVIYAAWAAHDLLAHQAIVWVKTRPVLVRLDFMQAFEPCLYGWRKGHRPRVNRRPPSNARNVWTFPGEELRGDHPTMKPLQTFSDPYTWHLKAGGLGLEPFSGSGTAIMAAEVTGRRCFAIEIAPAYVDVACLRYQRTTGTLPVLDATGEAVDFDA